MKLIDRYEFTNGKAFETYYLDANDTFLNDVPECDVIGFQRVSDKSSPMIVMRPDEALIQARMLIDAVNKVTSGYEIELSIQPSKALAREVVDQEADDDDDGDDEETKAAEAFAERAWSGNG